MIKNNIYQFWDVEDEGKWDGGWPWVRNLLIIIWMKKSEPNMAKC